MKRFFAALLALALLCVPALAFGPAGETVHGVDVSVYQGNVDFARVAQAGVRMVYIRSTLGFSYVDPTHERNADGARAAGLEFGFYHFCTASTTDEAVRQARFFAQTIARYDYGLKPVLELSPARALSRTETTDVALAFLQEVERLTGREPAIYCSASTPREDYDSRLASYSLWVAQYGAREPESNDIWPTWAGWQYSERGRVDGIEGNVDLDLFTAEMRAEPEPTKSASPTAAPTPSPAPTATCAPTATAATGEANAYVVQEGDTLTLGLLECALPLAQALYRPAADDLVETLGLDRGSIARDLLYLSGTIALTPTRNGLRITLLTDSDPRSYHYKFELDVDENGLHGDVYESEDGGYVSVGRVEVDATDGLYVFLEDYSSDGYLSFDAHEGYGASDEWSVALYGFSAALSYDLEGYGDSTHLLLNYNVSDVGSGSTVIEREASLRLVDDGGVTTWTLNFLKPMSPEGNGE